MPPVRFLPPIVPSARHAVLLLAGVVALATSGAQAATPEVVRSVGPGGMPVVRTGGADVSADADATRAMTPHVAAPAAPKLVAGNLRRDLTRLYNVTFGWGIAGPGYGEQYSHATAFQVAERTRMGAIVLAANAISGDAASLVVEVHADADGLPGPRLSPAFPAQAPRWSGQCCAYTVVPASDHPIVLEAGVTYWLVLTTTAASDLDGSWQFNAVDRRGRQASRVNDGPWYAAEDKEAAYAIYAAP